ncbi:hypothetical protein BDV93DRAFT_528395 [Ceratobasidium sp. AG-I]|nr:hypothetical protein BDV93DRAFT_528395 [Ceratobasidium sp. AG-I]
MESELLPGGQGELRLTNHHPEIAFANLISIVLYRTIPEIFGHPGCARLLVRVIFIRGTGTPLVAFISSSRFISRGTLL